MWNYILTLFGFGKSTTPAVASRPPTRTPVQAKKSTLRGKYYHRGGSYYSYDDDSLIEDLMLIALLDEMYNEGDINAYEGEQESHWNTPEDVVTEAPEEDLLDMDVSSTPVEAAAPVETSVDVAPTPSYTPPPTPAPEPVEETRYSSGGGGSSYASGSSDYDSGSSDSGGGSDD